MKIRRFKKGAFLLLLASLALTGCGGGTNSDSGSTGGFTLVWSDEFDGDSLDTSKWDVMIGNGANYGVAGWGNGEAEYYQADNLTVSDGYLNITAKKEEVSSSEGNFSYTSGRIRTLGKASWTYGRFEARMSLPSCDGMWPAFWMLPDENYMNSGWPRSGEIDIMEARGSSETSTSSAVHYAGTNNAHVYVTKTYPFSVREGESFVDFHTYALEWDEWGLYFYVDDTMFYEVAREVYHPETSRTYPDDDNAPFHKDFHILLNLAVGGNFDNGRMPPMNFTEATMKIDYVRVYQWDYLLEN